MPAVRWRLPICVAVGSWLLLAWTAPGIPIVWDEGEYLTRADLIVAWLRLLSDWGNPDGGLHAFSKAVIQEHWRFIDWSEGHPAWFAIPIALSKALLTGPLSPLTAARLGPITVFSAACGAVSYRLLEAVGPVAAVVAPIALLTFPRIFSEAHFATQDAQLTAWWLMLWVADSSLRSTTRQAFGVGILLGLTGATKFTGWLASLPVIVSRLLRRDAATRRQLLLMLPIGLLAFCLVNPPLWHDPLAGLAAHVQLSLSRADTFNIPTAFLGRIYDVRNSLPWYNTIAWLVMVAPVPILALGLVGLGRSLRTRTALSLALVFHWGTLMVVRALPGAPPHDGIRLFLPAFGFWCVFAGIGAQQVWDMAARLRHAVWRGTLIRAALVASLVAGAINLARVLSPDALALQPACWGSSRRRPSRHGAGLLVGRARQRRLELDQRAHQSSLAGRIFNDIKRLAAAGLAALAGPGHRRHC